MLCHHSWTDLLLIVIELPQMRSRKGRETGDQSVFRFKGARDRAQTGG